MGPLAGLAMGYAFAQSTQILENITGRRMQLWGRSIDATYTPALRNTGYNANWRNPNVLPSPDGILEAWRRGFIHDNVAADALISQGIFPPAGAPTLNANTAADMPRAQRIFYQHLWERMSLMAMVRPSYESIIQASVSERIAPDTYDQLSQNLFVDHNLSRLIARAQYQAPGVGELWQLWRRNVINDAEYAQWCARVGWFNTDALNLAQQVTVMPTLYDMIVWRRHQDDPAVADHLFARWANAAGYTDNMALRMAAEAQVALPGPSDLVRFAVREAWDEETARAWGYDQEFPEPLAAWMRWHGMEWGRRINDRNGNPIPLVTWPQAYWRAHWQIISPEQAYRAVHLLRPDRIARYQSISPGVTAFTTADLHRVLKVSDYPPKMRAWLAAISFQPLRLTDIRSSLVNGLRNRQWAIDQLLDRGYVREDAEAVADLWLATDAIAVRRAARAEQLSIARQVVRELRTAYRMGGLDAQTVANRLIGMGWSQSHVTRMLALEDARAARENLQVFIRQMRRSYLTGALSDTEVAQSLTAARIAQPAIARYLRLWQSELGIERRSLSTAQVVQAVANGELPTAIAVVRLSRLGWTQPDAALLLQEAVAKLTRAQASAAQKAANTAARQSKALQAAQRQAQAAVRSAQSQLRRIYPLGTLKRQYCLGIRKGPTISALLLSQGYTPDAISALLKEWTMECEAMPPNPDRAVESVESYNRRQTPLGTLKQWWQNGIVTDQWTRTRLAAIGLEPGAIQATISLWQSTLGKKSGPSQTATPQTQPAI